MHRSRPEAPPTPPEAPRGWVMGNRRGLMRGVRTAAHSVARARAAASAGRSATLSLHRRSSLPPRPHAVGVDPMPKPRVSRPAGALTGPAGPPPPRRQFPNHQHAGTFAGPVAGLGLDWHGHWLGTVVDHLGALFCNLFCIVGVCGSCRLRRTCRRGTSAATASTDRGQRVALPAGCTAAGQTRPIPIPGVIM